METIFLIIIFIVPGLMHKALKQALNVNAKKESKGTIYEQLFYIVVNSTIISIATVFTMKKLGMIEFLPITFDELLSNMNTLKYVKDFATCGAVITAIWYIISEEGLKRCWFWLKNKYFLSRYNVELTSFNERTVWEEIMINQKKDGRKPLIAIYDADNFITAGFLDVFDQGDFDSTGMGLARTKKVTKLLKDDKEKSADDKLFGKIIEEYYDPKSGRRVVFFDSEKVYEHWDK